MTGMAGHALNSTSSTLSSIPPACLPQVLPVSTTVGKPDQQGNFLKSSRGFCEVFRWLPTRMVAGYWKHWAGKTQVQTSGTCTVHKRSQCLRFKAVDSTESFGVSRDLLRGAAYREGFEESL